METHIPDQTEVNCFSPNDQSDIIDALMSVGAYLKSKGLRKIEMTISNNARLRIEIDTDWAAELNDRFAEIFRDDSS